MRCKLFHKKCWRIEFEGKKYKRCYTWLHTFGRTVLEIIDTAEFQRLKWIEQTSYRVLYPSARHDRFIHSIGVYHLGQKAIQGFLNNCDDKDAEIVKNINIHSFWPACCMI